MLTPYLEALIQKGQATYKTAVTGWGNAASIIVPSNNYAVITDLLYYPFIPTEDGYYNGKTMWNDLFINQIWIRSKLGNNHFVIRPSITYEHLDGGEVYPSIAPIKIDTYLIHDSTIKFTYSGIDSPVNWIAIDNTALQDISSEEAAGLGSAGVLPSLTTIKSIRFSNGQWYNVPTSQRNVLTAATNGSDQLRQYPSINQSIGIGSNAHAGHIMNVGYVQIQGKPPALTS